MPDYIRNVVVATMDTGGISYSSDEYLAVGSTEQGARQLIAAEWFRRNGKEGLSRIGLDPGSEWAIARIAEELNDWYGIRVTMLKVDSVVVG